MDRDTDTDRDRGTTTDMDMDPVEIYVDRSDTRQKFV
jgi:hypothetical protein